jgi:hypothetical protein
MPFERQFILRCCTSDCDRLCSLVVRVPGYRTDMYCVPCEVRTEFIYVIVKKLHRLYGLVVRVPGYRSGGPGSILGGTRFFLEVLGLDRVPLSLVSTTEELLGRKRSVSGPESREYGRVGIRHTDNVAPYIRKTFALTSPTRGGRSVGIVRSRTQATEFNFSFFFISFMYLETRGKR